MTTSIQLTKELKAPGAQAKQAKQARSEWQLDALQPTRGVRGHIRPNNPPEITAGVVRP
jgi:hypothetical protein